MNIEQKSNWTHTWAKYLTEKERQRRQHKDQKRDVVWTTVISAKWMHPIQKSDMCAVHCRNTLMQIRTFQLYRFHSDITCSVRKIHRFHHILCRFADFCIIWHPHGHTHFLTFVANINIILVVYVQRWIWRVKHLIADALPISTTQTLGFCRVSANVKYCSQTPL